MPMIDRPELAPLLDGADHVDVKRAEGVVSLRQFLANEGLRSLFDWLTFSNETGVTKRAPQAFHSTLAALGVAADQTVHVGDTPMTDICGAQSAGLRAGLTVELRDRRTPECRPDFVLEHIGHLAAALERLGT